MVNSIEIHIGGRVRVMKFNQISLEIFTKNIDWDNAKTSALYATFYGGLYGGSIARCEDVDYTYSDVMDWVDELNQSEDRDKIIEVDKLWADTFIYKDWISKMQDGVRSMVELTGETKIKKKVKSTLTGSQFTNLHLEH